MNKLKYGTALVLLSALYGTNTHAAPRMIINTPIKNALYMAAIDNKPQTIERYLSLGYPIDARDGEGMTALCTAKEKGNDEAYDLLLKYGANDKLDCMQKAEELHNKATNATLKKYAWGALFFGGLGGTAIALGSGGGGGGSGDGSSDDGNNNSDKFVGNGKLDKSRDWTTQPTPTLNTTGEVAQYYTEDDFKNDKEYTGENFGKTISNIKISGANYLGGINAAAAFATQFGTDENGKFASNLQNVTVGVLDTGVWGNHSEFKTEGGSKVTGYNFDYGPCLNGDTSNCWKPSGDILCGGGGCFQEVVRLDGNGNPTSDVATLVCYGSQCSPYIEWANRYPSDYDWDNLTYYYYPNHYNDSLENSDDVHGTNVAGIIGANRDGKGNMGVAFANTKIVAARWDFISNFYDPLKALLDHEDKILAVNLSVGTVSDASRNASNIRLDADLDGYDLAVADIIRSYTKVERNIDGQNKTYADGMILVKAAGNEHYGQPDMESGIKLVTDTFDNPSENGFNSYSDILMLVVVSVDVKLDDNGKVTDYNLAQYSNACGVTKNYCIAAPGGDIINGNEYNMVYSPGEPGTENEYAGMMGTSQATPVVTGSLAFLKGAYPYMSSGELIELVLITANKHSSNYSEDRYGAGLLDLGAAATTYIPGESGDIETPGGDNFESEKINLSHTNLVVPAAFKSAMAKALPKAITAFDRYNRPFDMPMANYVTTTHAGYKALKNDVHNLYRPSKVKKIENGALSFAFSGSMGTGNFGFINAEYKNGKNTSGFSFSENTRYDADNYFSSALKNPFMSFNSAYGIHNTYDLSNGLGFKLEAVTGQNGLYDGDSSVQDRAFKKQAYALNAELQLHKSQNFGLALSSGILYEDEAMLGMNGYGAFDVNGTNTYTTGVTASWYLSPKLTLSGSYYQGYTQAQSFASNLLNTSDLVSESFAFDANYKYNKTTDFGFQISSPLRIRKGTLAVNMPSGRDNYSDTIYRNTYKAGLKPEAREYKFALYLNREITERLSVRSEMDVRVHPDHQNTSNDYRALLGLSWNFN